MPGVGMLWRLRFGAILRGNRTEIFETFSRPRNFAIEIARDRAEIRCAPRAAAIHVHNAVGVATALALQRPTPTFCGVAANEIFL